MRRVTLRHAGLGRAPRRLPGRGLRGLRLRAPHGPVRRIAARRDRRNRPVLAPRPCPIVADRSHHVRGEIPRSTTMPRDRRKHLYGDESHGGMPRPVAPRESPSPSPMPLTPPPRNRGARTVAWYRGEGVGGLARVRKSDDFGTRGLRIWVKLHAMMTAPAPSAGSRNFAEPSRSMMFAAA